MAKHRLLVMVWPQDLTFSGAELKRLEAENKTGGTMAYQQVEAKRAQQLELSKEYLEQQFDLALEQGGFMEGTSSLASALNYVVRAEKTLL